MVQSWCAPRQRHAPHAGTQGRTHARTHARTHTYTRTHTLCARTGVRPYVRTYVRTHARTHAPTHARTHTRNAHFGLHAGPGGEVCRGQRGDARHGLAGGRLAAADDGGGTARQCDEDINVARLGGLERRRGRPRVPAPASRTRSWHTRTARRMHKVAARSRALSLCLSIFCTLRNIFESATATFVS